MYTKPARYLRQVVVAGTLALFVVPLIGFAQSAPPLRYALTLTDRNLHVTLTYVPLQRDSTVFVYGIPPFGGQADIFRGVRQPRVTAPARLQIDTAARSLTVYYTDTQPVTLDYDIVDTHTDAMGTRGELFRPMIQPDYFFSHGVNLFLQPQLRQPMPTLSQSVRWAVAPPYRVFFGSYPYADAKTTFTQPYDDMLMAPITGATDLSVDKQTINGIDNFTVLRKTKLDTFNKESVKNYLAAYDKSIRSFWNDYDDRYFSLIIEPFLRVNHDASGIAYEFGFIGKYTGDTIMNAKRRDVISHEIAHHWIGQRLSMGSENQWFNEGFTDYTSFYCMLRAGLITADQFVGLLNDASRAHYGSSIRNAPNDSVFKNYWKLGDYQRLPYRRGSLFAFWLDNQILTASNRQHDIRDLLRDLYALRKRKGSEYTLTMADFLDATSRYLPRQQVQTAIDQYITAGNPIPFTAAMLGPDWTVTEKSGAPQFGLTNRQPFKTRFVRK